MSLLVLALTVGTSAYGASKVLASSRSSWAGVTTFGHSDSVAATPDPQPTDPTTINGKKVIHSNGDIPINGHPKPGPWQTEANCVQPPDQSVKDHATFTPAELRL